MSQFTYEPPHNSKQNHQVPPVIPALAGDSVRLNIIRSYLWMTLGLLLTALTAWFFAYSGAYIYIYQMPMLMIALVIGQVALVIGCSAAMKKASASALAAMFLGYAFLTGITMSSLFLVYTGTLIFAAFLVSAAYFACLVIIGLTTKLDLTRIGTVFLGGLIVLILAWLVMSLLGLSMSTRLYGTLGLILFAGITAWDNQRLKSIMIGTDGMPVEQKKWSIYFALSLYLDFINIFLYVLRLIGAGASSRK